MDKNILIGMFIMSLLGIIVMNITKILDYIYTHIINTFCTSILIEESSDFYYMVQKYIILKKNDKLHNYYYRTCFDYNLLDNQLFFNYGFLLIKYENSRILFTKNVEKIQNSNIPFKNTKQKIILYSFNRKALFNFISYIEENYGNNENKYYFNENGNINILGKIQQKTFDNVFLNDNTSEIIKNDLDNFIKLKENYYKIGLRYKRVYLFHGEAGTGKSSITVAMANYCKRNILNINKSKDLNDEMLIKLVTGRPNNSIIAFEDIDCLFENLNRDSVNLTTTDSNKEKVTLSCLLNILDGCYTPEDVIFVITTNHIDKLDNALLRDGRCDLKLEITKPNKETINKYINYLNTLNKNIKIEDIDLEKITSLSSLEKKYLNY